MGFSREIGAWIKENERVFKMKILSFLNYEKEKDPTFNLRKKKKSYVFLELERS